MRLRGSLLILPLGQGWSSFLSLLVTGWRVSRLSAVPLCLRHVKRPTLLMCLSLLASWMVHFVAGVILPRGRMGFYIPCCPILVL